MVIRWIRFYTWTIRNGTSATRRARWDLDVRFWYVWQHLEGNKVTWILSSSSVLAWSIAPRPDRRLHTSSLAYMFYLHVAMDLRSSGGGLDLHNESNVSSLARRHDTNIFLLLCPKQGHNQHHNTLYQLSVVQRVHCDSIQIDDSRSWPHSHRDPEDPFRLVYDQASGWRLLRFVNLSRIRGFWLGFERDF